MVAVAVAEVVAEVVAELPSTVIAVPNRPQTNTVAAAPRKMSIAAPASPAAYPTSIKIAAAAAAVARPRVTPPCHPTFHHAAITVVRNVHAVNQAALPPQPQSMKMAKKPRP